MSGNKKEYFIKDGIKYFYEPEESAPPVLSDLDIGYKDIDMTIAWEYKDSPTIKSKRTSEFLDRIRQELKRSLADKAKQDKLDSDGDDTSGGDDKK